MRQVVVLAIALASWTSQGAGAVASDSDETLPFIADDYGRALSQARAQKKPIFVEAWAPW
jgi:hypothetical protein